MDETVDKVNFNHWFVF